MGIDRNKILKEFRAQKIPVAHVGASFGFSINELEKKLFNERIYDISDLDNFFNYTPRDLEISGYSPKNPTKITMKPKVNQYVFLIGKDTAQYTKNIPRGAQYRTSHGWVSVFPNEPSYVNGVDELYKSKVEEVMKNLGIPPRQNVIPTIPG